jgi:succinylglutamic semialdehyde dehydrogenase
MSSPLPLLDRPGDYIAGRFVQPDTADGELVIASPADLRQHVATHAYGAPQVERAIEAARAALPGWKRTPEPERKQLLRKYQERVRAHREQIASAIVFEVGKPLWEARTEVDAMVAKVDLALGEGARFSTTQRIDDLPGEIRYRPLGVLAVIGPFNFPGHLPNGQIVPALLLGNCVVHKPSEKTPSAATWIARCFDEAGLPPGVFNVVQGPGSIGGRLSVHPDIDGVLFTGSVAVGSRIVRDNASRPERLIALELGGKNAAIVLDDCDLERSARAIAFAAFATAGQRCTSTSRVIATPRIADALEARLAQIATKLCVGYPLDDEVFMGPLISGGTRETLVAAQQRARDAGFVSLAPGGAAEVAGHEGYYVRASVARAPDPAPKVEGYSDSELFGPDVAVYRARDLDAAIELANASRFGLAASVFTANRAAFDHAADELRVGVVHWNRSSAGASGRLPFGGVKDSGNHRPAGILAGVGSAYAQAVLLESSAQGPMPDWPGLRFEP